MADTEIRSPGFHLIIRSGSVTKEIQKAIMSGLKKCGSAYYDAVIENLSLDDHTLEELRRLGHPYAVSGGGTPVHDDDRLVHEQSGELKDSIKLEGPEQDSSRTWSVHLSSDSPYIEFLLNGTSKMRPRRFDEKALEDIGHDNVFNPLTKLLQNVSYRIG